MATTGRPKQVIYWSNFVIRRRRRRGRRRRRRRNRDPLHNTLNDVLIL
jgi:signal recognition particle subunit SEC65